LIGAALPAAMSRWCPIDLAAGYRNGRPIRASTGTRTGRWGTDEALAAGAQDVADRVKQVAVDAIIFDGGLLRDRWNGRPAFDRALIGGRPLGVCDAGHHQYGGDHEGCAHRSLMVLMTGGSSVLARED
jgi:hypothetical protein